MMLSDFRLPCVNAVVVILPVLSLYSLGWSVTLIRPLVGIVSIYCLYRLLDSMGLVKVVDSVTQEAGKEGSRLVERTFRNSSIPIGRFEITLFESNPDPSDRRSAKASTKVQNPL
jgi:hypothetical protein